MSQPPPGIEIDLDSYRLGIGACVIAVDEIADVVEASPMAVMQLLSGPPCCVPDVAKQVLAAVADQLRALSLSLAGGSGEGDGR